MELSKLENNELENIIEITFNEGSFLRDKLKKYFESKNYNVKIEYPTRFDNKNGRCDLVVSYENISHKIIFVIEVKRLNKDYSGLVCLGNLKYSTNFKVNLIGSNHEDPTNKIQLQDIKLASELPFVTELYQIGKDELNKNKYTNVTLDHTGKQIKTLMQIYENTISYLLEEAYKNEKNLKRIDGNTFYKFKNTIIIPIIITNTDINLIDVNINDYDIQLGKINENVNYKNIFKTINAGVINFSLNAPELNEISNKFQKIIIISTKYIDDFFDMFTHQISKYCQNYQFIKNNFTIEELSKITRGYDQKINIKNKLAKNIIITYKDILNNFNNNSIITSITQKYRVNYFNDSCLLDDEIMFNLLNEKLNKDKELFKLTLFLVEITVSERYPNLTKNILFQEQMLSKCYYRLIIDTYDYMQNYKINEITILH